MATEEGIDPYALEEKYKKHECPDFTSCNYCDCQSEGWCLNFEDGPCSSELTAKRLIDKQLGVANGK